MRFAAIRPTSKSYLSDVDISILRTFSRSKVKTLGDVLTSNILDGSKIMMSLEKLINFGFIRREWSHDLEFDSDVIYVLTTEGKFLVEDNQKEAVIEFE